jgi:hypothetical protein
MKYSSDERVKDRPGPGFRSTCCRMLLIWLTVYGFGMASAQLRECREVSTEVGLKIVRDGVSYDASTPGSDVAQLVRRLNARLSNDTEEFRLIGGNPVVVVHCVDRRPRGKGDFDASTVEQLDLRQVVLEVWGTVEPESRNGLKGYTASLQYVLIPARENELQGKPPRSVYAVEKWQQVSAPAEEILRQEGELELYTHVATGMKSLSKKQYNQAYQYLCRAEILLKKKGADAPGSPLAEPGSPTADLLKFTQDLTAETFQSARHDPSYQGWMKDLASSTEAGPCRTGGK